MAVSKEPGRRRAREMQPGHGVPPQGLCTRYCRFQTPTWAGSWVRSSLCSGVPSLSEALRLRWRPQLPSPPWPLPPARTDPMLCRLFLLTCSYRAKVSSPGSAPVSGWPRGRCHTWSPGLSAVGRPSWGALRGKGKGDGEGVNGGEIGSDRCGQTERPREARTELQVWGDPEGPRQTEIPTERKRQNARC